jgi:hypothetical protein
MERHLSRNIGVAALLLTVASVIQYVLVLLGLRSEKFLLGITHPVLIPLSIAAAAWSYGAVIAVQRLVSMSVHVMGRWTGRAERYVPLMAHG